MGIYSSKEVNWYHFQLYWRIFEKSPNFLVKNGNTLDLRITFARHQSNYNNELYIYNMCDCIYWGWTRLELASDMSAPGNPTHVQDDGVDAVYCATEGALTNLKASSLDCVLLTFL